MRLKDRINEMIEQYSITHDNPTVLRELNKLAALTQVVIDWVNNNDPTDFTEQIKQINDRMDEIETLVRELNLEEISTELEALRASVADAVSKAAQALTEAGQAKSNADQALTKAGQVETSLNAYKTSNDQALEDLEATLTEAVSNADTKAEAAMTLADGADTNASNALTKAGNALTKAEQAVLASGTAMNAAGEATEKAEAVEQALSGKQDVLTFDQAPTADSQNPVTSGGVYKAIRNADIELDDNVTQTSQNGVKSSGIYKFVKDNSGGGTIALDDTVTADSQNGVKSSGIHAAIEAARTSLAAMITAANAVIESHTDDIAALHEFQTTQDTTNETHNTQIAANKKAVDDLTVKVTDNEESVNTRFTQLEGRLDTDEVLVSGKQAQLYSKSGNRRTNIMAKVDKDFGVRPADHSTLPTSLAVYNALADKQDTLTFDQTPTADSQNPVTSGGVFQAIQDIPSGGEITLDDTVTENSSNGVKSSGIYQAIENARTSLKNMIDAANIVITSHTDDIAALQEFQQTQEVANETHNTQITANKTAIDRLTISKQDQLKTGETNISTDVITSMNDTAPEDGKLATAKAVWERIESKGSGGGSITYTGVTFEFPKNNIITLPNNFVPVFYMMTIESANDNYDNLYVKGFAPYYVSGLYPLSYLQNILIATKTDFKGGNVIGFDIFTSKNLLNFTTNNRIGFVAANISSIMLSSGEKPFTPLKPPSEIIIYGFYL